MTVYKDLNPPSLRHDLHAWLEIAFVIFLLLRSCTFATNDLFMICVLAVFVLKTLMPRAESFRNGVLRFRWQMYVSVAFSVLACAACNRLESGLLYYLVRLVHVLLLVLLAALCYLVPIPKRPPIVLPPRFPIGTCVIRGSKPLDAIPHDDPFHAQGEVLSVRVWYPTLKSTRDAAVASQNRERTPLIPEGASALMFKVGLDSVANKLPLLWLASHLELAIGNALTNVAPLTLDEGERRLPLVVLSHGLTGIAENYTVYGENLAAQGYVVAAPLHRDGSACVQYVPTPVTWQEDLDRARNFRTMQNEQRLADVKETIEVIGKNDIFGDIVDTSRCAVIGHSFGGATAAAALKRMPNVVVCAIGYDTWMWPAYYEWEKDAGKQSAMIFVNSDKFQWNQNLKAMRTFLLSMSSPSARRVVVTIFGTGHHAYNDFSVYARRLLDLARHLFKVHVVGESDALQVYGTTMEVTRCVLDNVLLREEEDFDVRLTQFAEAHTEDCKVVHVDESVKFI